MKKSYLIIDVREPDEYKAGHIKSAINIPPGQLLLAKNKLANVAKDTPIILYCRSGSRSEVAIQILKVRGFTNLTNGINSGYVQKMLFQIN